MRSALETLGVGLAFIIAVLVMMAAGIFAIAAIVNIIRLVLDNPTNFGAWLLFITLVVSAAYGIGWVIRRGTP